MSRGKWTFWILFFVALIGSFYFFLFKGTDNWKSKLPVLSYVEPFSFTNQRGQSFTQDSVAGKVYLANYFFVTCQGVCPKMNGNLGAIAQEYRGEPDVMFVSHTCQPELDSVPALASYAAQMKSAPNWVFLTGDKLKLYRAARESYHIDDPAHNVGDINDQFMHSQFIALVDRQGRVRGVYDGLRQKEMNTLRSDLDLLLKETDRAGFVNNIFGNEPVR